MAARTEVQTWGEGRRLETVHAGSGTGHDTTLCGDALEGNDDNGFTPLVEVQARINCPACLAVIRYAKSIPASAMVRY